MLCPKIPDPKETAHSWPRCPDLIQPTAHTHVMVPSLLTHLPLSAKMQEGAGLAAGGTSHSEAQAAPPARPLFPLPCFL